MDKATISGHMPPLRAVSQFELARQQSSPDFGQCHEDAGNLFDHKIDDFERDRPLPMEDDDADNPLLPDGPDGLSELSEMMVKSQRNACIDFVRVFVDGKHVILHASCVADPCSS